MTEWEEIKQREPWLEYQNIPTAEVLSLQGDRAAFCFLDIYNRTDSEKKQQEAVLYYTHEYRTGILLLLGLKIQ